ncbi:hypothetical protein Dsin_003899 [Dipteronia sinensis]|uniref:Cytochrome P450 n=1 Tax=Dipteronia sinensis TaxID=43782 RepID=A0AAE0B8J0_9ROSI|nr:hypothetical protein Dsin_003899 [Dipteronia sinensis]
MLIAGTHTTVLTIDLFVSQLIAHPEAFEKARDEIDNHVGDSRLINDADLANLPFLHGTISETLRFGPVKVLPAHESSEDCTVRGYHIPRGTQLFVNAWAIHSDPELWIEPDRFKPERFLIQSEKEKGGFKFIPFGLGRRVCPGEGLGMRVMALSLGTLIQCFEWEEVKEDQKKAEERHVKIIFRPREALAKTLLSAGTDTSAAIIEWANSLLLNHPAVLNKGRADLDNYDIGHDRLLVDEPDLAKLPYIDPKLNKQDTAIVSSSATSSAT